MLEGNGFFMTPEEVADLLKVSIYTVRRWINQQEIPAYKVGRGWRIGNGEFKRWLEDNRHGGTTADARMAVNQEVAQGQSEA
jgi:excisionase family DNA binding protein